MAIPADIWERLKLYMAEEGTGRFSLLVVRGKIVGVAVDDGADVLLADQRFRKIVRSAAAEILDWPVVVDRIAKKVVERPENGACRGKSLTAAQGP